MVSAVVSLDGGDGERGEELRIEIGTLLAVRVGIVDLVAELLEESVRKHAREGDRAQVDPSDEPVSIASE